jgi:hypothetical protein
MRITRWLLVGFLYLVADLANPLVLGPFEVFEGEEQSVRTTSRARVERLSPATGVPAGPTGSTITASRPSSTALSQSLETRRGGQPRKVPTIRPDSASAPEDH